MFFPNGFNDWTVSADNGDVLINSVIDEDMEYIYLDYGREMERIADSTDTDATTGDDEDELPLDDASYYTDESSVVNTETDAVEVTGETSITISSESLGITKQFDITFYKDRHMSFSEGK